MCLVKEICYSRYIAVVLLVTETAADSMERNEGTADEFVFI